MKTKPIVLIEIALTRLLTEFARELGLSETMASTTSQIHMQLTELPEKWSRFLLSNCADCRHSPESCAIFNPKPEQTTGTTTVTELRAAYCTMVETGRMPNCPLFDPEPPADAGGDHTP
jgi:hypothetical protein